MKNDKSYAELIKPAQKPPVTKEELAEAMRKFLESGGKVTTCPAGQMGETQ